MIAEFVADSSVGVAWAVATQATSATDRLALAAENGAAVHVPSLWFFEVANVLVTLLRRDRLTRADYERARVQLSDARWLVDEDAERRALGATADLAAQFELSVYDAAYLELAQRLQLTLATRDSKLLAAAESMGLRTFDAR